MNKHESFDPILSASPLPLLELGGPHGHSTGHTAVVCLPDDAAVDPAEAYINRLPSLAERCRRRFWRYEIDMAHHTTWVTLHLPALEEAFFFTAKVCFTWTVADAAMVARFGIRDARVIIWRHLDQVLRNISRQFRIEDSGAAEDEMNRRLHKESGDIDYGLRLSLMAVNLHLDEEAKQHLAGRVGSRRAHERARDQYGLQLLREQDEHELQVLREKHTAEQAVLRGNLERARAQHTRDLELAAAKHKRDLDSVTAEHNRKLALVDAAHEREMKAVAARQERELATLVAQHSRELELASAEHERTLAAATTSHDLELKQQRVEFYRRALVGNSSDFVVLQLMERPDDIGAVVEMLHSSTEKYYARARTVMQDLYTNEMVNAADVEPLRQHVIDQLSAALNLAATQNGVRIEHDRHTRTAEKDGDRLTVSEEKERTRVSAV